MIRSRGSVPMAESISANLITSCTFANPLLLYFYNNRNIQHSSSGMPFHSGTPFRNSAANLLRSSEPDCQSPGITSTPTARSATRHQLHDRFLGNEQGESRMNRNRIHLAWLLLGLTILTAVATLPALAQASPSAAAAGGSNAQESQTPAVLNVPPVAATRQRDTSGPTGFSAPAGAHLNYYGGPIITNVQVIQVLYGSGSYEPHVAGTSSPTMGQFFGDFTGSGSGLPTLLWQYNTNLSGGTNQFFGNGTFGGLFQITPSGANNGSTINDSQIQSELLGQLSVGNLPAPITDFSGNPKTLYMIYFPPGKTLINPQGQTSCAFPGFCAYHGTTSTLFNGKHVLYGAMPDMQTA